MRNQRYSLYRNLPPKTFAKMRCQWTSIFKTDIGHVKQQLTILKNIFFKNKKGRRASRAYRARLLHGSPMTVTVKIFEMIVPMGIYKRFMKKKTLISSASR